MEKKMMKGCLGLKKGLARWAWAGYCSVMRDMGRERVLSGGEKGRKESNGFGQQGIRFDQDGEGYGDVGVDGN